MKRFRSFRLDTANQCLWHDEARVDLTPKAFDVLRYLVEHAGRLVTPEELLEAVWPDTYINPEGLRRYIQEIRKVLGDQHDKPAFIETLPKRGYQFIAPVVEEGIPRPSDLPTEAAKKLVGREPALTELDSCLGKVLRGQRQIVFITGEPGIGKTTLVDELLRRAASSVLSIRVARGQCVEGYGGKEPYYPMLEALSGLCRGSGGESLVRTLAAIAPTWLVQFPALVKREQRQMLQREILGTTSGHMLREIGEVLETITSENPLLLIFEDLHWADPSTVDLISALARRRSPAKLMVIGTYRSADVIVSGHPLNVLKQDLLVHELCHELALKPLSETEVAEYLMSESSGGSLPDDLVSMLYRQSEGNPLFMVTALHDMTERGLICRENESWQLKVAVNGTDLEVPKSLQEMIEAQISRLSRVEHRVLEAASLSGVNRPRFGVASRAAIAELEEQVFEDACEALSRRYGILRFAGRSNKLRDGTVSALYEFVHVLYREVCYRRIAPGRRAHLHRRLGEWFEAHLERVNEVAAWLAGHFERAEDWHRAIKYLQLSADTAVRRFEPRQAAGILQHALELVSKVDEAERTSREIDILEKLATIYMAVPRDVLAIKTYEALAARAAHDGLVDVEARALTEMAWPLSWSSSARSREILERALRLSAQQGDPLARARTRTRCFAQLLQLRWDPQDVEQFHTAFAEILNANDRSILAPYLGDRGFVSWICSEYREARRCLIESRLISLEAAGDNPYLNLSTAYLRTQASLTWTLLFLGEWGEALREMEDVTDRLDKNVSSFLLQRMHVHRAWVHFYAMDFAGALAICNSALALVRDPEPGSVSDHPMPTLTVRNRVFLTALAETALGNYDKALEHLRAACAEMDRSAIVFDWYWRIQLESAFTEVRLAKGDLAQARPHAEEFLKIALTTAEHTWQALAWEVNARVALAELDLTRAQDCIAKGLAAMEGFEVPLAAWRVHGTAADLYERAGDHDLADEHCELSRTTIRKLANSLRSDDPLRSTFLSAPAIRKILGDSEVPELSTKEG